MKSGRGKWRITQPWQLDLETRYTDAEAVDAIEAATLSVAPGHSKLWGYSGLGSEAQTVIPDGDRDVTAMLYVHWIIIVSGGGTEIGTASLAPGNGTALYASASEFSLEVGSNGSIFVERIAGTETADILLFLLWI